MANYSFAHGSIEVRATSEDTIQKVMYLLSKLENGDYNTDLYNFKNNSEYFITNIAEYGPEDYVLTNSFEANGRWCYLNNIEKMARWIISEAEYFNDTTAKQYITDLYSQPFSIIFDYVDYEPGCLLFGDYTVLYTHKANTEFVDSFIASSDSTDIDINIANLSKYAGYSFKEAMDDRYLSEQKISELDPDQYELMMEELEEQREDIEEFFWDSLENLLSELEKGE